jgi:hypothetical protein
MSFNILSSLHLSFAKHESSLNLSSLDYQSISFLFCEQKIFTARYFSASAKQTASRAVNKKKRVR